MATALKNMSAEELMAHYTGLTWHEADSLAQPPFGNKDRRRQARVLREIMFRLKGWEVGWTG